MRHLQESQTQNTYQDDLLFYYHLQFGEHERRKDRVEQIQGNRDGRYDITEVDMHGRVDAFARLWGIETIPVERYWLTFEEVS